MIVLVLVALLWLAVLVPTILSKLSERRSAGSIGRFHQQLDLLERTGPKLVQPAYRLTGTESTAQRRAPLVVPVSPPPVRPTLTLVTDADASVQRGHDVEAGGTMAEEAITHLHVAWSEGPPRPHDRGRNTGPRRAGRMVNDRRRTARRRRRNAFSVLCALTAVTGLMGLAHPLRGAWVAAGIFLALLVGFVALAAYAQRAEDERRHLAGLGRRESAPSGSEATAPAVRYLSEDELDLYYEGRLEDEETHEPLVAEG